jgi:hypothetical protein
MTISAVESDPFAKLPDLEQKGAHMQPNFAVIKSSSAPLASVFKVGLVILATELVIMFAMEGLFVPTFGRQVPLDLWKFLDPVLLTGIVAPVLYLWVLRPMRLL